MPLKTCENCKHLGPWKLFKDLAGRGSQSLSPVCGNPKFHKYGHPVNLFDTNCPAFALLTALEAEGGGNAKG